MKLEEARRDAEDQRAALIAKHLAATVNALRAWLRAQFQQLREDQLGVSSDQTDRILRRLESESAVAARRHQKRARQALRRDAVAATVSRARDAKATLPCDGLGPAIPALAAPDRKSSSFQ